MRVLCQSPAPLELLAWFQPRSAKLHVSKRIPFLQVIGTGSWVVESGQVQCHHHQKNFLTARGSHHLPLVCYFSIKLLKIVPVNICNLYMQFRLAEKTDRIKWLLSSNTPNSLQRFWMQHQTYTHTLKKLWMIRKTHFSICSHVTPTFLNCAKNSFKIHYLQEVNFSTFL